MLITIQLEVADIPITHLSDLLATLGAELHFETRRIAITEPILDSTIKPNETPNSRPSAAQPSRTRQPSQRRKSTKGQPGRRP